MQLSTSLTFPQLLTKWSATLNPIIAIKFLNGNAVNGIALLANTPQQINHGLGRNQVGFFLTDQNAAASVYRVEPFNAQSITLEASANVTINLWCY